MGICKSKSKNRQNKEKASVKVEERAEGRNPDTGEQVEYVHRESERVYEREKVPEGGLGEEDVRENKGQREDERGSGLFKEDMRIGYQNPGRDDRKEVEYSERIVYEENKPKSISFQRSLREINQHEPKQPKQPVSTQESFERKRYTERDDRGRNKDVYVREPIDNNEDQAEKPQGQVDDWLNDLKRSVEIEQKTKTYIGTKFH